MRKLCEGGVAHSFGIHVARLAGIPRQVVDTAEKMLKKLEGGTSSGNSLFSSKALSLREKRKQTPSHEDAVQLSIFQLDDPVLESVRDTLKKADMNRMTPMDAFDMLRDLQKKVGINN